MSANAADLPALDRRAKAAVLVDADNVSHHMLPAILEEASKHGDPLIRRVYGDWSQGNLAAWKKAALGSGFKTIHQERVNGKGSTDAALIIDAMQLHYETDTAAFCIVASDGDYRRLMLTLRELGRRVVGMGEEKTPKEAVAACTEFVRLENLAPEKPKKTAAPPPSPPIRAEVKRLLERVVSEAAGEDGWAHVSTVGSRLKSIDPGFDTRTFGFKQLTQMFASLPQQFQLEAREIGGGMVYLVRVAA